MERLGESMKFERLSENSIRCLIGREELMERQLNVEDMAYGSVKTKKLFEEMISRASDELGFVEGTPLVIEAIPLKEGAIEVILTKVDSPDELDVRFSKFAPMKQLPMHSLFEFLEGAFDKLEDELKNQRINNLREVDVNNNSNPNKNGEIVKIFAFGSIDKAADACKHIKTDVCDSILYKNEKNKIYYLVLTLPSHSDKEFLDNFNKICNTLAEYGEKIAGLEYNLAYYSEHYQVIIKENAVEKLNLL